MGKKRKKPPRLEGLVPQSKPKREEGSKFVKVAKPGGSVKIHLVSAEDLNRSVDNETDVNLQNLMRSFLERGR